MSDTTGRYREPPLSHWRQASTYDEVIEQEFLLPLRQAAGGEGAAPRALQEDVLRRLHWYFTVDARERAPTVFVTQEVAPHFLARVGEVLRFIAPQLILDLAEPALGEEVRLLLYAWHGPEGCTAARVGACDHARELLQVNYYLHGPAPAETWLLDGVAIDPAHGKYRACRYYYRAGLHQRIAWLPIARGRRLQLLLNGKPHPLVLDPPARTAWSAPAAAGDALWLEAARAAFWPGQGGRKQRAMPLKSRLKLVLFATLARLPWIRARFRDAWVFVDRDINADDNAEHLYRWVREHHPEINAWFLLDRGVSDWTRLQAEGFRLVPPGLMQRLLLFNSKHVISSHGEFASGKVDRSVYGSLMGWKATYLRHGVGANDQSAWWNKMAFDRFIISTPAEQVAMVAGDGNYSQTSREVCLTGFPRHDRLIHIAHQHPPSQPRHLLVMPTWRGGTFEAEARSLPPAERLALFARTEYAQAWGSLLRSARLRAALEKAGWRLVFMPHVNTLPYLEAFALPSNIEVVSSMAGGFQQRLVAASAFLTDYTSVAFDFALLRRPIFYFQFDREAFYHGGHNWRPGHFDYDRDGFGPVAADEDALLAHLEAFFSRGGETEPHHLQRMHEAMPFDDGGCCQRVYESIRALEWSGDAVMHKT